MTLLHILEQILKEIEKNNPFKLVVKGGTALSVYYCNHHRESEDLDFDADTEFFQRYKEIEKFLVHILATLKQDKVIIDYRITKSDFAATNRYHIKLELKTHTTYFTKIDLDFVDLPQNLVKRGHLNLYAVERIFIGKLITFTQRKEFKDIYDIAYLFQRIDLTTFKNNEQTITLIQRVIEILEQEDCKKLFRSAFRNVDLRFKNLKESSVDAFIKQTILKLRIVVNRLKKQ